MPSRAAHAIALGASSTHPHQKRKRDGDTEETLITQKPFKSKVLILCSRGITYRMRHLMTDISNLVTHGKKGQYIPKLLSTIYFSLGFAFFCFSKS